MLAHVVDGALHQRVLVDMGDVGTGAALDFLVIDQQVLQAFLRPAFAAVPADDLCRQLERRAARAGEYTVVFHVSLVDDDLGIGEQRCKFIPHREVHRAAPALEQTRQAKGEVGGTQGDDRDLALVQLMDVAEQRGGRVHDPG
ncbi:hypothetical protein D3C76_896770 [compost metagenome]